MKSVCNLDRTMNLCSLLLDSKVDLNMIYFGPPTLLGHPFNYTLVLSIVANDNSIIRFSKL